MVTSPYTFVSTGETILYLDARPVFVDVEPSTRNLDPALLAPAITPRTRAVVTVSIAGHPCRAAEIAAIAKERGIPVIEDAAQAHGAEYKGRRVGSLGDRACFSFYAGENLGAYGACGIVVTSHDGDARTLKAQADAEATARESLALVHHQFELGAANYLALLNAERQAYQTKIGLVQAQAARFADTAALYQALRGGWWHRQGNIGKRSVQR